MNKIASVILFDVGCRKLADSEDHFFFKSKKCLSRLFLKKLFSGDSDEIGLVLFGSESTEVSLPDRIKDDYCHIRELFPFGKVNFRMLDEIEKLSQCKGYVSDWIAGMIVALEYLKKGAEGKRFKLRQIVVVSEFPSCLEYSPSSLTNIAACMKDLKVKMTVVGPELDQGDEMPKNLKPLFQLFQMMDDPLSITVDELTESVQYFDKKRKTKRVFNVDLEIGSLIKIPVGWVKLTSDSQRFSNWVDKQVMEKQMNRNENDPGLSHDAKVFAERMEYDDADDVSSYTSSKRDPAEDIFKITKFGKTDVTFSAADINALKRESGPPSFKILMFTSKSRVNPTMYVGEDVFAVTPREGSSYSHAKLYALIDAMREKNKVAIARRIVMRNGKIQLGALLPFSDECGKHLYFLKLPTVEWIQPFPRHRNYPTISSKLRDSFKNLVDSMRLETDIHEDGKGVLVPDPLFQLRCELISRRAIDPSADLKDIPHHIKNIVNPRPEFKVKEDTQAILKEIMDELPLLNSVLRKEATRARALSRKSKYDEFRQSIKQSNPNGENLKKNGTDSNDANLNLPPKNDLSIKTEIPSIKVENNDEDPYYNSLTLLKQLEEDDDVAMNSANMIDAIE